MSNTPSVPLRLDSLQLATGSTSSKAQPCAPHVPSLNSAAGSTKGDEKSLLRYKRSKGQHSRGQRVSCTSEKNAERKERAWTGLGDLRKKVFIHTQARK